MHTEKTLSEELKYSGKIFDIVHRTVELENGDIATRDVLLHNGAVAVLPLDDDDYVYLVQQYRSPIDAQLLEMPAGKLEKGEQPLPAAKRELKEECGITAEQYTFIGDMLPAVGYSSEVLHLYLAQGLSFGETDPDEDEFITTEKIAFDTAVAMCTNGTITDSKTIAAILKVYAMKNGIQGI